MRVKISYGTDIKNVPSIATKLGDNAVDEIKTALNILHRAIECIDDCNEDYSLVLEQLAGVSEKLKQADLAMEDIHAILVGLNNYYIGETNVPNRRPTVDSGGNPANPQSEQ